VNITHMALMVGWSLFMGCQPASGAVYKWIDCDGRKHFTNQLSSVPLALRLQVDTGDAPTEPSCTRKTAPVMHDDKVQAPHYIVPLHQANDVLFVEALLNDTVRLPMLIDTGASYTIIPIDIAHRLGLPLHASAHIPIRAVGQTIQAPLSQVRALSIGHLTRHHVPVLVYGDGIDQRQTGILGMSFLKHFEFTIDVLTRRIILTPLASQP
jgi:clan AA aspartic protease (TIGR02281 family)